MSKKLRFLSFILAVIILISSAPDVSVYAQEEEALPTEITNPFRSDVSFFVNGTPVTSNSYRIPSIVTLADGTIVAAADIRWNTTYDGGGLDTLVARSTDGGKTWTYNVANYLGDNGNIYNPKSTTFIDPNLLVAADGQTVYMLVDLYAYGVALNGKWNGSVSEFSYPTADTGFDANGNLKLSSNGRSTFGYYLKDGKIYANGATEPEEGYSVDAYFNVTYTKDGVEKKANLFCADSPFQVAKTQFLYLTKSTDGGASWSVPTLLNLRSPAGTTPQDTDEDALLISPGNAITTSTGLMVYPVYSYAHYTSYNSLTNSYQHMGLIYSADGVNWERTENFEGLDFSSEGSIIELENGNLRVFFRNETGYLCYVDYDLQAKAWKTYVQTEIPANSNTQLSAITYSKTSDGKQVILISCPTGPNGKGSTSSDGSYRTNGKIHVFTVDAAGKMNLEKTIDVFDKAATGALSGSNYTEEMGFFAYSCLTELADGSIALLYENNQFGWGAGDGKYYTITNKSYSASDLGIVLDAPQNTIVDKNGNTVSSVTMGQYEKPELTANAPFSTADVDYQWQIEYEEDKWVNIYGEDTKTVKLSYGMVATLLGDDGKVDIRCKTTAGTQVVYSKPITVTIEMYQPQEPNVVVSESFTTSSGETVTVTVAGALPEDVSVQLGETDSTGVEVKPSETVVAALDISIKNADGTEWQPASGETVTVTLEASKIGLKNGDEFVVYHLHNGEVSVPGTYKVANDTISFEVDGFSKFVFALAEMIVATDDLQADINKTAIINNYTYLWMVKDPSSLTAYTGGWYVNAVEGVDYLAGIEFTITDAYVSRVYPYGIFYKVKAVDSENLLTTVIADNPWVFQRYQDDPVEAGTLILQKSEEPAEPSVSVTVDGAEVTEITVSTAQKVTLTATPNMEGVTTYKWQLLIPQVNMWVDISGQTSADCIVNYGMVANRLDSEGKAHIRCVTTVDGTEITSEAIAVNIASVASYSIRSHTHSTASSSSYAVAPLADETGTPDLTKHNLIVKFYLKDTSEEIYQQYLAEFTPGETRTLAINIPQKAGYTAYWYDGTSATEITGDTYTATFTVSADTIYAVRYFPDDVPYYVIHYIQNVADDGYTQYGEIETKYGKTDSVVPDVHKTIEGFYNIPYVHASIAPDGSTKIEVYYDRWYHLMTFDLGDGGYGVDPVYARYSTEITVGTPTRPGYTFNGWMDWNGANIDVSASGSYTFVIPHDDVNVTARWTEATAKYTIVYWKENAAPDKDVNGNVIKDDNGDPQYSYSYWAQSQPIYTKVGTVVSGSDSVTDNRNIPKVKNVTDADYFTYNDARTDKDVLVKGDGTTVVNVYYTRNSYTLYFYANGDCGIPLHSHTDGTCDTYLICGKSEHTHSEACGERVISCGVQEHTAHTDACLQCGLVIHNHTTAGCKYDCGLDSNHNHSKSCYSGVGDEFVPDTSFIGTELSRISGNAVNGYIGLKQTREAFSTKWNDTSEPYIYINGTWYKYSGSTSIAGTASATCGQIEGHVHEESCYECDKVNHVTHTDSCYKDSLHTHIDSCYTYPDCDVAVEHKHTDTCWSACTKVVHASHNNCPTSNGRYVVSVITAKYEADISAEWPVRGDTCLSQQNNFYGWKKPNDSTTLVSKRPIMTADLCNNDATNKTMNITVVTQSNTSDVTLSVWLESIDQDTEQTSNTRKLYNGKYYDLSTTYSQPLKRAPNGTFGAKDIMGMEDGVVITGRDSGDITIHYDRLRKTVTFYNADKTTVATYNSVMYEYPVKKLTYTDNGVEKSVSTLVPAYPKDFEPNAYEFKGWYTTPECFNGSEFNFETGVVPNDDLNLYAKWVPVTHTVKVYMDDTLENQLNTTEIIDHGSTATSVAKPTHPDGLEFVTWMYKTKDENGNTVEKAFDFSMQIKQDMEIYAVWRSTTIINYEIHYVGIDNSGNKFVIAAPTKGQQIWGKTETFEPKGTDYYYPEYQDDGYFAKTASHSIVMGKNCTESNPDCTWDPVTKTHNFTFYYELGPVVPYEVHYYHEGTTNPVFTDSNGNEIFDKFDDNRKSVVIATARMAVGLKVDAPQKSLVVIKGAENKIIFYYSENANVSYYTVTHYLIHKDGTFTEYQSIPYNAMVGDRVENTSANVAWLDIPGFTKDEENPDNLREGTVTKDPILELTMYYIEKEVTIKYEVAGNVGGTVSVPSETLGAQFGVPSGSVATPAKGYKFVGWYSHWDCLDSQWLSGDPHYKPTKADTALWVEGTTYYAKFEYNLTSLAISKVTTDEKGNVVDYSTIDPNQTFIFNIKGDGIDLDVTVHGAFWTVVVDGLKVGATYTITEKTDWSWRYNCTGWSHTNGGTGTTNVATITLGLDGTITFTNERTNEQWLDGDSWLDNLFSKNFG